MIGSIRKHSKWLWIVIAGLTIISFVVFMGSGPVNSGGSGGVSEGFGTIYGKPVTAKDYVLAKSSYYIDHRVSYGQWPDKGGISADDQDRDIYVRIMLNRKAAALGIKVGEDVTVNAASQFLRQMGRNGQPMRIEQFVDEYLKPEGLGVADFQNFLHDRIVVQQLAQTLGLPGAFITPQTAGALYDRQNQEIIAQAVFFEASNYVSKVASTPAAIAEFYTNNQAAYRESERVQVSYVFFDVTNYLAQAKADWEKTNLTEYVEAVYRQYGQTEFADAKTPDEAKTRIREMVIRDRALASARKDANSFATALNSMTPVKAENLAALAREKSLAAKVTAPFSAAAGPLEFTAPPALIRSAFQLNAEEPFSTPIVGMDGVYVLAAGGRTPSYIPPLESILARVTKDYQSQEAIVLAQRAGSEFRQAIAAQMAAGKTFATASVSAGQAPVVLPAFSLSTGDLPEISSRAPFDQVKRAAFNTPAGQASPFIPGIEGGFILYVQELVPVDQAKKTAALPQFMAQHQRERQGEAFNLWVMTEANRELRDTAFFKRQMAGNGQPQP